MSVAPRFALKPGRVYRTRDLSRWGANAPRLAKRLVREGKLTPLAHGLYAHLRKGRFGAVPLRDEELMRGFLDGSAFVFTGPDLWNSLGLRTTGLFSAPLVYNAKRSGTFDLGLRSPQGRLPGEADSGVVRRRSLRERQVCGGIAGDARGLAPARHGKGSIRPRATARCSKTVRFP